MLDSSLQRIHEHKGIAERQQELTRRVARLAPVDGTQTRDLLRVEAQTIRTRQNDALGNVRLVEGIYGIRREDCRWMVGGQAFADQPAQLSRSQMHVVVSSPGERPRGVVLRGLG